MKPMGNKDGRARGHTHSDGADVPVACVLQSCHCKVSLQSYDVCDLGNEEGDDEDEEVV